MPVKIENYIRIKKELEANGVTLVAVSKTKPVEDILELYNSGQRDFGENYVQELVEKANLLPKDIRWHYIGHLQSNKVKLITPIVQLIHGVDSLKLLKEINKQAEKNGRVVDCLLQVYIAREETKFGLDEQELYEIFSLLDKQPMHNIKIKGLMGMASFTEDSEKVRKEFIVLKTLFHKLKLHSANHSPLTILSMGMSNDYKIAIEEDSTMVRIGSLLFGERTKK
jgi:pyridoxal phosphate enzyme (YggS family)